MLSDKACKMHLCASQIIIQHVKTDVLFCVFHLECSFYQKFLCLKLFQTLKK